MGQKTGSLPLTAEMLRRPLLEKLSDMASRFAGIRFAIVFPSGHGWDELLFGGEDAKPRFCREIGGHADGAKQCRMCHILMTIAACGGGKAEQRCHAGGTSVVVPVTSGDSSACAVVSTCLFSGASEGSWKAVAARAEKLGLPAGDLKGAYEQLPRLDGATRDLARSILEEAAEAVREIVARVTVEQRLRELCSPPRKSEVRQAVERRLRGDKPGSPAPAEKTMGLIAVVSDLIDHSPNMPFTVMEIAAAARMTPNHFSALFRKETGRCFSEYLSSRRMALAESLLQDRTLNINEVAERSGYDDPGYFARRFKQKHGVSPREWRRAAPTAQRRARKTRAR